ncbi:hypothetical protein [Pedobacter boryungensis]|uniref:Uncharacterized protein n=1 Tax=Pedobacter boryungensis TaxID=869962 RepID=A0ABX2DD84_9SPHI|nr:hypothetical protein [Pedobacter boryungensis]NQX30941.1 hypothetical protein [Pedobacter boryungensis]
MQQLILNEKLILSIESLGKKVRLIISELDTELACRKETIKNLERFLIEYEAKIFKGRLQLHKYNEIIEVVLKSKPIAVISSSDFKSIIDNL